MLAVNTANVAQRSLSAVVWNYAGAIARALAQLGVQVVLARVLGPQVYGQFAVLLVVIGFGWLLAESGMGAALIQMQEVTDDAIRQAIGAVLLQGGIVGLALMGAAPYLASLFDEPALTGPLMVCGPLVVLQGLCNIPASLMRRNFDMKRWQLIQVGAYVTSFGGLGIALALTGWGVWSLVAAFACQSFIAVLAAYSIVRHPLRPLFRMSAGLRSYSAKVLGSALASWAVDTLDRAIVGRIWGVTALGAYSAALGLARAPATLLSHSVHSVSLAMASRLQSDNERLCRGYCAVSAGMALVLLPAFALLAVASEPLILLLYGDRWIEAIPLFRAFAVAMPCYVLATNTASFMWATGSVGKELASQLLVATVLLLGFAVSGALPLSLAVWLVPIAHALRSLMLYLLLSRRIGLAHRRFARALAGGLVLAAAAVGAWLLSGWLPLEAYPRPAVIVRFAFVGLLLVALVVATRGLLIGEELCGVLRGRLPSNRVGRLVSRVLGL
ncbi:lipopolysaccharide biosynthesis protein [Caldimonas brevitalea]|uniref:Lipopolysaccharide biosynthesis protein WzxC n=1 Tax=Caldimonas brevitalea TaxID=413882 RepID=A0A0G3BER9_9BURK|nr:lipopolysaccharide biosynthesis protein [Caldimonas brevitalea]AKJ27914.1 lipopolysaccharide biosynthesis protein WzxC [Caldimonas brevitalea]